MSTILERSAKSISDRIAEIAPIVEEHAQLEEALRALADAGISINGANGHSNGVSATTQRQPKPRAARKPRGETSGRRGRPAGSGKTQTQIVELLSARPGLSIKDTAEALGVKANYLYRAMPNLVKTGVLREENKGYHVVASQ